MQAEQTAQGKRLSKQQRQNKQCFGLESNHKTFLRLEKERDGNTCINEIISTQHSRPSNFNVCV